MAKLAYAAWVKEELENYPEEDRQEVRYEYWSDHGRIVQYDKYVKEAKRRHKQYDPAPDGYYEYYSHFGHTATAVAGGAVAVLSWFLLGIIGGASRNHHG
jgi:hypothetical protein